MVELALVFIECKVWHGMRSVWSHQTQAFRPNSAEQVKIQLRFPLPWTISQLLRVNLLVLWGKVWKVVELWICFLQVNPKRQMSFFLSGIRDRPWLCMKKTRSYTYIKAQPKMPDWNALGHFNLASWAVSNSLLSPDIRAVRSFEKHIGSRKNINTKPGVQKSV